MKLKPCPFCGEKVKCKLAGGFGPVNRALQLKMYEFEHHLKSKCVVMICTFQAKTKQQAIRKWNKRVKRSPYDQKT